MINYCLVIYYYIYSDPTLKSPISVDPIVSVKLDSAFQEKEDVEFYKTYIWIVICYIIQQVIIYDITITVIKYIMQYVTS